MMIWVKYDAILVNLNVFSNVADYVKHFYINITCTDCIYICIKYWELKQYNLHKIRSYDLKTLHCDIPISYTIFWCEFYTALYEYLYA